MTRRTHFLIAFVTLALAAKPVADRFKTKLSGDLPVQQALNRLTFGARPGDIEQVKKIGLKKWIDRQLHPQSLAENPKVEQKLAAMKTLTLELRARTSVAIERNVDEILDAHFAQAGSMRGLTPT